MNPLRTEDHGMSSIRTTTRWWAVQLRSGLLLALLATLLSAPDPGVTSAHELGPNYESKVLDVKPKVAGFNAKIEEGGGDLIVKNTSTRRVIVEGYEGEPFARMEPDGRVYLNLRSPAYYLNEDIYGRVEVPERADPEADPEWKLVASDGTLVGHDHRVHWMSPEPPPNVKGVNGRKKIFDWKVPVRVGDQRGSISGTLWWVGEPTAPKLASYVVFGTSALIILICAIVLYRRTPAGTSGQREASEAGEGEEDEAW